MTRIRAPLLGALLGGAAALLAIGAVVLDGGSTRSERAAASGSAGLSKLPLDFVENRGQWPAHVRFVARKGPLAATLERDAVRLSLDRQRLGLTFEGAARAASLSGERPRGGRYNFFVGNDPAQWRSNVRAFSSVRYRGLYRDVDLRLREHAGMLEYDLLVAPGGDPERVIVRADGASRLMVGRDGALLMRTGRRTLRQAPPVAWQLGPGGVRQPVVSRFRLIDPKRYGFETVGRDPALPLVIDPGLDWATFVGGSGDETIEGLEVAGNGEIVVAGQTWSPDFGHTGGDLAPIGGTPYVARLNASGSALVYATFFGGSFNHSVLDLALDATGRPAVVGDTNSLDFPTTAGAYDRTPGDGFHGDYDAYVIQFNATGSGLVFGTYLGSSPSSANLDQAWTVGFDPAGSVVVAGITSAADFPTTSGAYDRTHGGGRDIFVSRLSATGSQLTYSSFLGGSGSDEVYAMAVDSQGFVNLTGKTSGASTGAFPTTSNGFDRTADSQGDGYLARLKLDGGATADLKYSTFLGGAQWTDAGTGIAVDPSDPASVTVGGWTRSGDFPTTAGALQRVHLVPVDGTMAFASRFRFPTGATPTLAWSTLYGAPGNQSADDITVDSSGAAIIAGGTAVNNPPTTAGAYDRVPGLGFQGKSDGFVARISADGSQLLYSTLLGGAANGDVAWTIAYAGGTSVIVGGLTNSTDFPVTAGALDTVYAADGLPSDRSSWGTLAEDAFLARLTLQAPAGGDTTPPAAPLLRGPANNAAFGANVNIAFDWADVADASGIEAYHLQISPNSTFTNDIDAELSGWWEPWLPTSLEVHSFSVSHTGTFYWRVQALDRAGNLGPYSAVRSITVSDPAPPAPPSPPQAALATVKVSPDTINAGSGAQGTVTLTGAAPAGGALVPLASEYPQRASVPASVTVPAGSISATFTITAPSGANNASVAIAGEYGGVTQGSRLYIISNEGPRELYSLTVDGVVTGQGITGNQTLPGGATAQASVALAPGWQAGPSGAVVALGSTNPALVSVPDKVTIAPGATSASFAVTTHTVSSVTRVALLASRSWTIATHIDLLPAGALQSLTLNPQTVVGGNPSQGTISLAGAAPAGGTVVALSVINPEWAQVPPTVTVPAGSSSATFTVTTSPNNTGQGQFSIITASAGGIERSQNLNVNPGPAPPPPPPPPPPPGGDSGLRSPTAQAAASGGDGNGFESSATSAFADDSAFAVDNNSGSGSNTSCGDRDKDKHVFRDYGFSIPTGSTIKGIEIRLDAKVDSTSSSPKMCVQLSWDGGSSWTATKSTPTLSTSQATYILGGSTNTWGRTWSIANFSNTNFRVRVIDVSSSTARDFSLDWVAARVYT